MLVILIISDHLGHPKVISNQVVDIVYDFRQLNLPYFLIFVKLPILINHLQLFIMRRGKNVVKGLKISGQVLYLLASLRLVRDSQ